MNTKTVPPVPEAPPVAEPDERTPTSWAPVDMSTVGTITEKATILRRVDHVGLLYPARLHWLAGESESGKTWVALIAIREQLNDGHNVAYLDFEDHPRSIKARLIALGVDEQLINDPGRFVYVRPDEPLGPDQVDDLVCALNRLRPSLVVADGVSEAMALEGADPISTPDVVRWIGMLPRKVIATTGAAVVVIDHQTKSTDRGGWAFGSQHKKAGTDVAYEVVAIRKPRRALGTEPTEGIITVRVTKDRPGYVRGHCPTDLAATIRLTGYPDGGMSTEVTTDQIAKDHGLRQSIAAYLHNAPGASKSALRDVTGKNDYIDQAVGAMIAEGLVRVEREGSTHAHYLTEKGIDKYPVAGAET